MDCTMRKFMLVGAFTLVSLAALGLAATSPDRAPAPVDARTVTVDADTATGIANAAFEAFEVGDYAGWSHDWSAAMHSAIPEQAFQDWRSTVIEQLGEFVSLGNPALTSRQPETYRWSFPVTFERGTATIGFGFAEDGSEVQGVFVE
jgi:hypothetical protein